MEHLEANKIIAEFMEHLPDIEYAVGNVKDKTVCYQPKCVAGYFPNASSQKAECERWLKEQREKYPDGWVTKEGYETIKYEHFLYYSSDWNDLMPVWLKIAKWGWDKHEHYWQQNIGRDAIVIKNFLDINILIPVQFGEITIEAVCTAVVEFIKWHNTQTKVV